MSGGWRGGGGAVGWRVEGWWRGEGWRGGGGGGGGLGVPYRTEPSARNTAQYIPQHTAARQYHTVPILNKPCSRIPARGRFQQFMVRCFFGAKSFGVLKVVTTCWILQTPSGTE